MSAFSSFQKLESSSSESDLGEFEHVSDIGSDSHGISSDIGSDYSSSPGHNSSSDTDHNITMTTTTSTATATTTATAAVAAAAASSNAINSSTSKNNDNTNILNNNLASNETTPMASLMATSKPHNEAPGLQFEFPDPLYSISSAESASSKAANSTCSSTSCPSIPSPNVDGPSAGPATSGAGSSASLYQLTQLTPLEEKDNNQGFTGTTNNNNDQAENVGKHRSSFLPISSSSSSFSALFGMSFASFLLGFLACYCSFSNLPLNSNPTTSVVTHMSDNAVSTKEIDYTSTSTFAASVSSPSFPAVIPTSTTPFQSVLVDTFVVPHSEHVSSRPFLASFVPNRPTNPDNSDHLVSEGSQDSGSTHNDKEPMSHTDTNSPFDNKNFDKVFNDFSLIPLDSNYDFNQTVKLLGDALNTTISAFNEVSQISSVYINYFVDTIYPYLSIMFENIYQEVWSMLNSSQAILYHQYELPSDFTKHYPSFPSVTFSLDDFYNGLYSSADYNKTKIKLSQLGHDILNHTKVFYESNSPRPLTIKLSPTFSSLNLRNISSLFHNLVN